MRPLILPTTSLLICGLLLLIQTLARHVTG